MHPLEQENGTRYMVTYAGDGVTAQFPEGLLEDTPTDSPFNDNNSFGCGTAAGDVWYAVGLDFDVNGKFLGYVTAICNQNEVGIQVAVIADLYDVCMEFEQVYDETQALSGTTNKAYTNRVWNRASEVPTFGGIAGFTLTTPLQPFGSTWLSSLLDENKPEHAIPGVGPYAFIADTDGTPLWCGSNNIFGLNAFTPAFNSSCTALPDGVPRVSTQGQANIRTLFESFNSSGPTTAGLFKPPQIFATNPVTCATRSTGAIARSTAASTNAEAAGIPTDEIGNTDCGPGPANTFTINGMTGNTTLDFDGDEVPDEATRTLNEWDGLVGFGSFPVTLQFFAFADHNRMPIRQVKVDFADGSQIVGGDTKGYFKNAKPYCAASIGECGNTQLTCNAASGTTNNTDCINAGLTGSNAVCGTPASNFGNQDRACTENFFEYNYVYRCYDDAPGDNKVQVGEIENDTIRNRILRYPGISESSYVCAYRPRVQVTDNWGWCNATDGGISGGLFGTPCELNDIAAWTSFAQTAYVVPKVAN
jgi:hypothetical protein